MKITVSKSIIENILSSATPFLEKKDTSQITSHIYLDAKNNSLTIKATDHEIGFEVTTTQVNIQEEGTITANGKKFLDIVKILKDEDINLETINNNLQITQNSSNFKLPTFAYNEFPNFPTYEGKPKISIESHKLIESLKKITPAIDTNNPKFELNGSLLDIKKDAISFVATDTKRLAVINIQNSSENELSLIIPRKAIIEIQKLFFEDIELYYDETYLLIHSQQYTFFTKLTNGKYPEYKRIIPKDINFKLQLPKKEIIEAIKQITTVSNEIKITFDSKNIIFEAISDDNTEAKTQIQNPTPISEQFSIAVNSRYILDFLNQIDSQEFEIELNQENLPFVVKDNNFITVIMPIVL